MTNEPTCKFAGSSSCVSGWEFCNDGEKLKGCCGNPESVKAEEAGSSDVGKRDSLTTGYEMPFGMFPSGTSLKSCQFVTLNFKPIIPSTRPIKSKYVAQLIFEIKRNKCRFIILHNIN